MLESKDATNDVLKNTNSFFYFLSDILDEEFIVDEKKLDLSVYNEEVSSNFKVFRDMIS